MTVGVGKVLATRELRLNQETIFVVIGKPQSFPQDTGLGYFCRFRIDGLESESVGICSTGQEPGQSLVSGLAMISERLGIELSDFLSDAYVGVPEE